MPPSENTSSSLTKPLFIKFRRLRLRVRVKMTKAPLPGLRYQSSQHRRSNALSTVFRHYR